MQGHEPRLSAAEQDLLADGISGGEALQALAVFVLAVLLAVALRRALVRAVDRQGSRHIGRLLGRFLSLVVVALGAVYALDLLGVRIGPLLGALGVGGIALAYLIWVKRPGTSRRTQERFAPLHTLFSNRWYGDEIIDTLIVRPSLWLGRFAQSTFERVVVNGLFVGGPTSAVRAGSAAVRAAQTGFLRSYAALVVVGTALVTLYFLLA